MPDKKIVNLPAKNLPIVPLTKKEIHDASAARLSLITKEFANGFNFLKDYPISVTFFGSARYKEDDFYYQKARSLAVRVVEDLGYPVFTGGGPGIMEGANRGAMEAGGQSFGLTIELPHEQSTNPYLTKHLDFYYFFSRKVCMTFSAEAFIFFPGGIGTMDEFFEILTLVQTGKIEKSPIILVGVEFWSKMDEFLRQEILSRGLIDAEDVSLYTITDNEDQIIDIIRNAPVKNNNSMEFPHTPSLD
jgi:uncharacterized protein (TIGR00730 family)